MSTHKQKEIVTVEELMVEMHQLLAAISAIWAVSHRTTNFRSASGNITIQAGVPPRDERYIVHTFLLDELPAFAEVLDEGHRVVNVPTLTPNFQHIVVWLKLRWLVRLHSAVSEIDYKVCGMDRLLTGILRIMTTEVFVKPGDSIFHDCPSKNAVALHLPSFLDEVIDGINRCAGISWNEFINYVRSCDYECRLNSSNVDMELPSVVSNALQQNLIDDIFVAYLLRLPPSTQLTDVLKDMKDLMCPMPEILPLDYDCITQWLKATTRPQRNTLLKKAQRQLIHVVANVELRSFPTLLGGKLAPPGQMEEVDPKLFEVLCEIVSHHVSFPAAIRERIYSLMSILFKLSDQQYFAMSQRFCVDWDRPTFSREQLTRIKTKVRGDLWVLDHTKHSRPRTQGCRLPTLASRNHDPLYFSKAHEPDQMRVGAASKFGRRIQRSLTGGGSSRPPFRVPQQTGPYVWDRNVGKFRNQEVFSESGFLGNT